MKIPNKKTKILATTGPSSNSSRTIKSMLLSGANCFRLNFSHGTHEEHESVIKIIRSVGEKLSIHVGILADLQGPKIRTGKTPDNTPVILKKGSIVELTPRKTLCTEKEIYIDYPTLADEILEKQFILINDGAIRLHVLRIDKKNDSVICRVLNTGSYVSHKGVNFPNTELRIPSLTKKDRSDLHFILTQDINFVALSFVRQAKDINTLSRIVRKQRKDIKIIAKIEKPEALHYLPAIIDACDGIMIARGDLGVETSPFKIPVLQKNFIAETNKRGKIVIVATQMLESMVKCPIPTRAELTDVANAIFDGTDAVMLSGETATGDYPVESVDTMTKIAQVTEESIYYPRQLVDLSLKKAYPPHAICEAAQWASRDLGNVPVLVFTASGETALYLAKTRNQSRIFAFTPYEHVACMLSLAWNTASFVLELENDITLLQQKAESILIKAGLVKKKDIILVVSGTKGAKGATNFLRVKQVGKN